MYGLWRNAWLCSFNLILYSTNPFGCLRIRRHRWILFELRYFGCVTNLDRCLIRTILWFHYDYLSFLSTYDCRARQAGRSIEDNIPRNERNPFFFLTIHLNGGEHSLKEDAGNPFPVSRCTTDNWVKGRNRIITKACN